MLETRRQSRRKIKPYLTYDDEDDEGENDGNDSGQSSDYDSDYTSEESDYYTTTETEQSDNEESEQYYSDKEGDTENNDEPHIVDHATGEINRGTLEIWKLNTDSPVGRRIRKIKRYGGRARILYDATFMRTLEMEEAKKYTDAKSQIVTGDDMERNDGSSEVINNQESIEIEKEIETDSIDTNHNKDEELEIDEAKENQGLYTTSHVVHQSDKNNDNSNDVNNHSNDVIINVTRGSAEKDSNSVFVHTSRQMETIDGSHKKRARESNSEVKIETNNTNDIYSKFDIDKKLHIEFEEVFDTIVETHVETIEESGPVETVYTNQIFIDSVRGDIYDEDCTSPHVHTPNSSYNYPYNATVTTPKSGSISSINYPYFTKTTPTKSGSTTPRTPSTPGQYHPQHQQQRNPFFPDSPSFQFGYNSSPPYTSSPIKPGKTPEKTGQDPSVLVDYEGDYVVIDLDNNNIKCRDRHSSSVFMYVQ